MKHHFKRTFDRLELSAESQERICAALSAHMREPQEKPARLRTRPGYFRLVLIAAVLAFAVALTGFAFKEQIISLLGGGKILQYQNEEGKTSSPWTPVSPLTRSLSTTIRSSSPWTAPMPISRTSVRRLLIISMKAIPRTAAIISFWSAVLWSMSAGQNLPFFQTELSSPTQHMTARKSRNGW